MLSVPISNFIFVPNQGESPDIIDALLRSQEIFHGNPINNEGLSHFHIACAREDATVVEGFLKSGVNINYPKDYFANWQGGYTPLHFAAAYSTEEVVKLLLRHGADVNAKDRSGSTALHAIAENPIARWENFKIMLRFV